MTTSTGKEPLSPEYEALADGEDATEYEALADGEDATEGVRVPPRVLYTEKDATEYEALADGEDATEGVRVPPRVLYGGLCPNARPSLTPASRQGSDSTIWPAAMASPRVLRSIDGRV